MTGFNYSFEWYTAVAYETDVISRIVINKWSPGNRKPKKILKRTAKDFHRLNAWCEGYVHELNVNSVRNFLKDKPSIFTHFFELSLSSFKMSSETIKHLSGYEKFTINNIDMTLFLKDKSIGRIQSILLIMSRWGILWEFKPGLFASTITEI